MRENFRYTFSRETREGIEFMEAIRVGGFVLYSMPLGPGPLVGMMELGEFESALRSGGWRLEDIEPESSGGPTLAGEDPAASGALGAAAGQSG